MERTFSLSDLKQTRVYQEGKQEGLKEAKQEAKQKGRLEAKLEAIPRLVSLGLTVEQIAQALDLDIAQVRKTTQGD
ncbi:MAG: Rpn family recombination-promoting nuclease/putative transposase [Nostoc sp. LLA-1]|nr:Rpn family recombination-promoting nuclease/putative transposase [Cyanocohniella sp. LLY]